MFNQNVEPDADERKAAIKDCAEQQKDREQRDRRSQKSLEDASEKIAEAKLFIKEVSEKNCRRRYLYNQEGKDDPVCAGIAPDIDLLQSFHEVCEDKILPREPWCGRLIPVHLGKKYPRKETPAGKQ